jgi:hypothetical protein
LDRVTKVGLPRTIHEMGGRNVLRRLVAADSRRDNGEQDEPRAPSQHLFLPQPILTESILSA